MPPHSLSFRLTATVAIASLLMTPVLPLPAGAQGLPPPAPPGVQDQRPTGDPPERVGRLARVNGTVSFHTQDEDQWSRAAANYRGTSATAFGRDPNAQADIEVSATRMTMAPNTE